jgi:hypothetical protein
MKIPISDISIVENVISPKPEGPWIAGGAVRLWSEGLSVEDHDIDVWFSCKQQGKEVVKLLNKYRWDLTYKSNNALTFTKVSNGLNRKIQLIQKCFYDNVDQIINDFDLTCCQFAYDGSELYTGKFSVQDVRDKYIRVNKWHDAIYSRVAKYIAYGYTPTQDTINGIIDKDILMTFEKYNEYD